MQLKECDDECFNDIWFDGILQSNSRPQFFKSKYGLPFSEIQQSKLPFLLKLSDLTRVGITMTEYTNGCSLNSITQCWEDNNYTIDLSGFDESEKSLCECDKFDDEDDYKVPSLSNLSNTHIKKDNNLKRLRISSELSKNSQTQKSLESLSECEMDSRYVNIKTAVDSSTSPSTCSDMSVTDLKIVDGCEMQSLSHTKVLSDEIKSTRFCNEDTTNSGTKTLMDKRNLTSAVVAVDTVGGTDGEDEENWDDGFEGDLDLSLVKTVCDVAPVSDAIRSRAKDSTEGRDLANTTPFVAMPKLSLITCPLDSTATSTATSNKTSKGTKPVNSPKRIRRPDRPTLNPQKGPMLIRPQDMPSLSKENYIQWNSTSPKEFECEDDWGDLGSGEVEGEVGSKRETVSRAAGLLSGNLSNTLSVHAKAGMCLSSSSGGSGSVEVRTDYTRASASTDFSLSGEWVAGLVSAEGRHKDHLNRIIGLNGRAYLDRVGSAGPHTAHTRLACTHSDGRTTFARPGSRLNDCARSSSSSSSSDCKAAPAPPPPPGSVPIMSTREKREARLPSTHSRISGASESQAGRPSWLKSSGPVLAVHDVQMDLKPSASLDESCSSARSSLKGTKLLTSARLSASRRTLLKEIWQIAKDL